MHVRPGVETALHSCVLLALAPDGKATSVAALAEFHDLSASYLSKTLQALERAGIVRSEAGRAGGFRLARPADGITVLDVFDALEGDDGFFRCDEIRQRGVMPAPAAACRRPCAIASVFSDAEDVYRDALAQVTLADVVKRTHTAIGPNAMRLTAGWLAGQG